MSEGQRRVVVTGIGAITPIGIGVEALRRGLRAEKSAVTKIDLFDTSPYVTHLGAQVRGFEPSDYLDPKQIRRLDKFNQYSVASSKLAFQDAHLDISQIDPERMGVCLGTALGGIAFAEQEYSVYVKHGARRMSPMLALNVFDGAGACYSAIELGLQGPTTANGDSCASAPIAMGHALDLIRDGTCDLMLTGGVEAPLAPLCFGAFALIKAMSQRNDDPGTASRPFDNDRDGFVLAEGAAMFVLEEYEHAKARGARIYGELLSHFVTNNSFNMVQPGPEGKQAARCMTSCLKRAHVQPHEVGYINAHGSSTPLNDAGETIAIKRAFGEAAYHIPISSTKSYHGHALGASGAWEAAVSLLALKDEWLPPTLNLKNPDPDCDLDYIPEPGGRAKRVDYVLSNSFGFGGINGCLLFGRVED